jgi:transposase
MGATRRLGESLPRASGRNRRRWLFARLNRHPGPPRRRGWKRGVRCNGLGRSRGGFSSKLHAISTSTGKPLEVTLTPGQQGDATQAEHLFRYAKGKALLGDASYDSDELVKAIKARGMKPVLAHNPTRKYHRRRLDRALYRIRYRIECMFHSLKRFRAVASRYEKTATNFLAVVHIACAMLWLN